MFSEKRKEKEKDRKYFAAKKPGKIHNHAIMAGMIKSVDDGVGRIMASLEELKLRENTIILFYSDNGGYGPATSMHPLKGYKGTYYEGGIREPFFVKWPGVIQPGSRSREPVIGVDLYPTRAQHRFLAKTVRSLLGLSRFPVIPELGAGSTLWIGPALAGHASAEITGANSIHSDLIFSKVSGHRLG